MSDCCIGQYMCGSWERLNQQDIRDNNTNETYNSDSECLIRFKCGLITIGNALRAVVLLVYDFVKLIWDIIKLAANTLWNFGKELAAACCEDCSSMDASQKASCNSAFQVLCKDLGILGQQSWKNLFHFVVDPFCCIAIEILAVYGLADPLNARKMIGKIEKYGLNDGLTPRDPHTYFLAPCFQTRHPLSPALLANK